MTHNLLSFKGTNLTRKFNHRLILDSQNIARNEIKTRFNRFTLKYSPMIKKYPTLSLSENENKIKPLDTSINFLLSYSKSTEIKKTKKHVIILCKN